MSKTDNIIKLYEPSSKCNDSERDAYVQELQRLLAISLPARMLKMSFGQC